MMIQSTQQRTASITPKVHNLPRNTNRSLSPSHSPYKHPLSRFTLPLLRCRRMGSNQHRKFRNMSRLRRVSRPMMLCQFLEPTQVRLLARVWTLANRAQGRLSRRKDEWKVHLRVRDWRVNTCQGNEGPHFWSRSHTILSLYIVGAELSHGHGWSEYLHLDNENQT